MARLQTKSRNPLPWIRKYKFYSLLLVITLLVAGIFVYEKVALELNKSAFQHARATIDIVYADIVKNVGPPDNSKKTSECSRPSVEFGKGPLSCSVDTDFIYGVSNKADADQLMGKIRSVAAKYTKIFTPTVAPVSTIPINSANSTESNSVVNYYTAAGLFCTIKYVYDTPRETALELKNPIKLKTFFIVLGCSDNARSQYFPLHVTI